MSNKKDLKGQRFGMLLVLEESEKIKGRVAWKCQCDCGKIKIVTTHDLMAGSTKSCGCLKHKTIEHPWQYYRWKKLNVRKEWPFDDFYEWCQENNFAQEDTLRLIDPLQKASRNNIEIRKAGQEDIYNPRSKVIEYNGEKHNLTEWAKILNIPRGVLTSRLRNDISFEVAILPTKEYKKKRLRLKKEATRKSSYTAFDISNGKAKAEYGMSGVYCIRNNVTNKAYIGSSENITKRWRYHLGRLKRGTHHSHILQEEWDDYGENSFSFYVLEYTNKEKLMDTEQQYIDSIKEDERYNICSDAKSPRGTHPNKETLQKIGDSHKKAVKQYSKGGKLLATWPSAYEAAVALGHSSNRGSSIVACCKNVPRYKRLLAI